MFSSRGAGHGRWVLAGRGLWLALAFSAGCGKDATGPDSGSIRVSLATSGVDLDPDGYTVAVDDGTPQDVAVNGLVTFATVAPGSRTVRLRGLAANCAVSGGGERPVTVVAGHEAEAAFTVACAAILGSIDVGVVTSGADVDADGYLVSVDGGTPQVVGVGGGTVRITGLATGDHAMTLGGVATNCTVGGDNPRTVGVVAGVTTSVSFAVTCVARVGAVRVTTATTQGAIDPDGYTAEIVTGEDSYYYGWTVVASQHVATNGSVTFPSVAEGNYSVILVDVASNCIVAPPTAPQVAVAYGATVDVTFTVGCEGVGSIRLTNATSGPDPDPDGFTVDLQGPEQSASVSLPSGGAATKSELRAGTYAVSVHGVAENCVIAGPRTREVVVVADATVSVALDATCTPAGRLAFVDGPANATEIYLANSNGAGVTRLTFDQARATDPAWSPDGQRLAFASDRSGSRQIWLIDASGSHLVQRTSAGGPNYRPAWSPDGRRIAFVSERDGHPEIYVMSADDDGSNATRLTNGGTIETDPAWSPDGNRIAFSSDRDHNGAREIYVMNADGAGVTQLTHGATTSSGYSQPAWSPDGRRIAFSQLDCSYYYYGCTGFVGVMNADGSNVAPLAQASADGHPTWSPDGRTLAFAAIPCAGCTGTLAYVRADGSGDQEVILPRGASPAWRR